MKNTISVSLEDDIVEMIDSYKSDNNLKARSAAVERMLLEWKSNINQTELMNKMLSKLNLTTSNISDEVIESNINNAVLNIKDIINSMIQSTIKNELINIKDKPINKEKENKGNVFKNTIQDAFNDIK